MNTLYRPQKELLTKDQKDVYNTVVGILERIQYSGTPKKFFTECIPEVPGDQYIKGFCDVNNLDLKVVKELRYMITTFKIGDEQRITLAQKEAAKKVLDIYNNQS